MLRISARAHNQLKKLHPQVQERIRSKLLWVAEDPERRVERLLDGRLKVRVGDYRIIVLLEDSVLWADSVRHRKNAYDEKRHA